MSGSYRKAILIAGSEFALVGLGTGAALTLDRGSVDGVAVERARNTATAQAACYSAGGAWEQRGARDLYPTGPEANGTCVSASATAQLKDEAEQFFASCLNLADAKTAAAAEGRTVEAYCYATAKWIAGGRKAFP